MTELRDGETLLFFPDVSVNPYHTLASAGPRKNTSEHVAVTSGMETYPSPSVLYAPLPTGSSQPSSATKPVEHTQAEYHSPFQYGSELQGIQANDLSVQPSNSEPLPLVSEIDDILCMLLDGEEEKAKQTSTSKEWSDIVDAAFFSPLPLPIDLACIKDVTSLLQPSSPKKQNTKKRSTGSGSTPGGMEEYSSTDASVFPFLPLPLPFPFNFASSDTSIQHDLKEQEDITL